MRTISYGDLVHDVEQLFDMVQTGPVAIRQFGHPTLVALSEEEFQRLKRRDHEPPEDFSPGQ
jgi:PHD/YefM family antitoxin component YafN of YafNO toxin-antitoxin module